ncbi:MAG: VCBS repeat-containing protein [Verrucomicrobia bacterium]|nr:VCBS repeat-containing protein [Verrucomicrobiota bacterium]
MNWTTPSFALGLAVFTACSATALDFQRVVIDDKPPSNPWIKIVGDLNGDNKSDIIIGGSKGPLVWYRNPDWKKFQIADGGYNSVGGAVADIDGDGDLDIAAGGVVWFENPRPESEPAGEAWTAHQVEKRRGHDIKAADLDADGKVDLVMRDQSSFGAKLGHSIFIYKQSTPTDWARRELGCPEGEGLEVADLNRDGRPDIVIGGRWFENNGDLLNGPWIEDVFSSEWNYADTKVAIGDLNADGRLDVILAPAELQGGSHRIAWYEAPANARSGSWKEHIVEAPVETVIHALAVADFDRDGKLDLVAARMHQGKSPQEVAVYFNGGGGREWKRQVIATTGSHDVVARDIDGDARPDILGANHGGPFQPVELWLNRVPGRGQIALGIDGSRFTLNGAPTFLLGFSYYGALGASEDFIRQDLDDFQRHGFNWLRVWATWDAHDSVVSALDADGAAREPFFSKLRRLVAECDRRGMIVDITLARLRQDAGEARSGQLPDFAAHQRAVETLCTALKPHRNWYLDLANERDVRDRRFVSPGELKRLRERVRELDLERLVTASFGGHDLSAEDIREALMTSSLDFLSRHRPRTPQSPAQTEAQTRACLDAMRQLGRVAPVHDQEPFRRGYGQWQPTATDFRMDLRGAVAGDAAGWCFHNGSERGAPGEGPRRSFDLRSRRLWEQLDAEERKFVEGAHALVHRP